MMAEFTIQLEARAPELGRWRAYRIDVGRDLFGRLVVAMTYGRIGSAGRTLYHSAATEPDALRLVTLSLRRRSTAQTRIGVGYREVTRLDPRGWIAEIA